jgi:hypothetical protein
LDIASYAFTVRSLRHRNKRRMTLMRTARAVAAAE